MTEAIFNTLSKFNNFLPQAGLISGLVCSIHRMTELRSCEYYAGIREYIPLMTFLKRPSMSYDLNGGSSVTIS